jgi:ParB family chromosome partitioning protein
MSKRASILGIKDGFFTMPAEDTPHPVERFSGLVQGQAVLLPVDRITSDPHQPRKTFPEESIKSLADSIREKGLLQPISVRKTDDGFIIVTGERRWRAHVHAGLSRIPAFIMNVEDPNEAFEISLVENLQREDLHPLEEAAGIVQLMERRGYKQKEVAQIVGRSEPQVSQLLKLNTLPEEVKEKVSTSKLSRDQLFQLAAQETTEAMLKLYDKIVIMGLNVRETRQVVKGQEATKKHPLIAKVNRFERFLMQIDRVALDQLGDEEQQELSSRLEAVSEKVAEIQHLLWSENSQAGSRGKNFRRRNF